MKGYHLSYLMKRAGLLMTAALVSSQVLGCCSWCRFDTEVGGKWSVWNVTVPVAPENRYARGDGHTDDTKAIQDHIDAARDAGGGIVFFPEGKYRITSSLYLWGGVYIRGIGGSTFGAQGFDALRYGDLGSRHAFVNRLSCAIVLDTDAAVSTNIITTDSLYYLSGVEGIALVGSRNVSDPYDTTSNQGYGIYMRKGVTYSRSQAEFRNVLIYATKGTGFYESENQSEAFLDHVMVLECGNNGFEFNGKGNRIERAGAGGNTATGFMIRGEGSDRFYDIDSWKNMKGLEIEGCRKVSFMGLNVYDNRGQGVVITSGSNPYDTAASQIEFYRGDFSGNWSWDFYLASNSRIQEGPSQILIHGCRFGGGGGDVPIYDVSPIPYRNVVSNCTFDVTRYTRRKVINKNGIYMFRDCMYWRFDDAGIYGADLRRVKRINTSYDMDSKDGQVLLYGRRRPGPLTITLPDLNLIQHGTAYYITEGDPVAGADTIKAKQGQLINGRPSITILQQYSTIMIVQQDTCWTASRLVAP